MSQNYDTMYSRQAIPLLTARHQAGCRTCGSLLGLYEYKFLRSALFLRISTLQQKGPWRFLPTVPSVSYNSLKLRSVSTYGLGLKL